MKKKLTKKKMPRLVYEVRFEDGRWQYESCRWYLFAPDGQRTDIGQFSDGSKTQVIRAASAVLTCVSRDLHILFDLVIKSRDGKIQDKRTYGEDPRKSRG